MDLIVQRPCVYTRSVRTPANGSDGTPKLIHAHGVLRTFITALPYANGSVVTASRDKLDAGASCECSVQGINDTTMSVESTHTLARREVRDAERMVGRSGVVIMFGERVGKFASFLHF